ncbi:MAG: hypothetical protein HZB47_13810 [Nitrosomonadales bacterium]|nr:hypothetical protein [Nitrosomonadales bacterium]
MRYVTSLPPVTTGPNTRQLGGVSAAKAVKPVLPADEGVHYVAQRMARQQPPVPPVVEQDHRAAPSEDRRKECRRLVHQPVLTELRSGIERRRHRSREGDLVDHIDETV